jgi:ribosomal protein S18 acetylase RimI-like enzyme
VFRAPHPEADADAVLEVMVARDIADIGQPDVTIEDVRAFWATPGVDLAQDAWVVDAPRGELVASGQLLGDDALIFVHPDACGRGVGTALRERAEARARERGTAVLRQFQPVGNEAASALLMAADYWPAQHYMRMRMPLDAAAGPEADGVRPFERERDELEVHQVVEGAMGEVEGHVAASLEVWRAQRILKEGWDPSLWLLLHDEEGLAGAALGERWESGVGYVAELGVAPRARGRGHGRTLLLSLFAAFRAAGLTTAELSVHGANRGAARLYESVGMRASWEAQRWEKALGHD